ncbi:MAG: type II toxin-antitoxin system PemK/MazF family toxin [Ignavibacteria bacterium]
MKQGEIWLINLDPTIGAEIRKTRPAVIVNDNAFGRLPLKIIVPITDWKEKYSVVPWMVKVEPDNVNHLNKISSADCFQVRSISELRFVKQIGIVNKEVFEQIKDGLAKVLNIDTIY